MGLVLWVFFTVVGVVEGGKYLKDSDKVNDSVIIGFVKSKYNKYCARITWKYGK
jgi:hypothetical protein